MSGLVGESKEMILSSVGIKAGIWWRGADADADCKFAEALMKEKHLSYSVVFKPDVGCRGAGSRSFAIPLNSYPIWLASRQAAEF
jgi:hypothetical protein